jgi:hypothetical protein
MSSQSIFSSFDIGMIKNASFFNFDSFSMDLLGVFLNSSKVGDSMLVESLPPNIDALATPLLSSSLEVKFCSIFSQEVA